jgi:hypothetical protein
MTQTGFDHVPFRTVVKLALNRPTTPVIGGGPMHSSNVSEYQPNSQRDKTVHSMFTIKRYD